MFKKRKIRNKEHRQFVSTLPCLVCKIEGQTQSAHIRHGHNAGMGLKSGDNHIVPLCWRCHREQHETGDEQKYWGRNFEKAKEIANALYVKTGDDIHARLIIARFS